MSSVSGVLSGPLLELLTAQLRLLIDEPIELRERRSQFAPMAVYFDQEDVTGDTVYTIEEAQSGSESFTRLFMVFEADSGNGRYMVTGGNVGVATGFPISAGGSVLTIDGHMNIKRFQMMAESGETLRFARVLFR